jgi:ornithine cyclodeaminase/alanine dehydrogenase-like protein (mu-crystallin family)
MRLIDARTVARLLTYEACIPIIREAMVALSAGRTRQLLRGIIPLDEGRMFGVMSGALEAPAPFGAKLVSVFPQNPALGKPTHQGVVVLFDAVSGKPVCIADAGEITEIRTAAASAVATDALARPDATRLALLGCGTQAQGHARALSLVRPLSTIKVWGRSPDRAAAFAARMGAELDVPVTAVADAREAVAQADIICTVTAANSPILLGDWIAPGAHLNIVGSSYAGPVEVDHALVQRARYVADSRESVLRQGAEFLAAKAAGLIGDDHIVAEIGEVLSGAVEGRQNAAQVTAYKSLGHVVQDLYSAAALHRLAQDAPADHHSERVLGE